jgi:hypothetical protein
VASVQSECRGAPVTWSEAPGDQAFGCCYYLPLAEQVALFVHPPGTFRGLGGGEDDDSGIITLHTYLS